MKSMTNPLFHKKQRQALGQTLSDGLIYLTNPAETLRNKEVPFPYRPNSDFHYLTGVPTPETRVLIDPKAKQSHLFIADRDERFLIWEGRQLTPSQAKQKYGFDKVHTLSEFDTVAKKLSGKFSKIYTEPRCKPDFKNADLKKKTDVKSLRERLNIQRSYKTKDELSWLKKANELSKAAHLACMREAKTLQYEYQVQALFESTCLMKGSPRMAYNPIVACGANAGILHYVDNDARLRKNDLLLIDAGCEWNGYASDITRTFPISGRFTKKQQALYEIVLSVQKHCISLLKPGLHMIDLHLESIKQTLMGLMDLGFFKTQDVKELYEANLHQVFYPHGLGHLLGLDTHDVGAPKRLKYNPKVEFLRAPMKLEEGFALTIEPGIYFLEAFLDSPKRRKELSPWINWKKVDSYRSVGGIRIEDNLVITKKGSLNLTTVPKEVRDVEKLASLN